jgi:hypothetical protein
MLGRWFVLFYELGVIEESALFAWREAGALARGPLAAHAAARADVEGAFEYMMDDMDEGDDDGGVLVAADAEDADDADDDTPATDTAATAVSSPAAAAATATAAAADDGVGLAAAGGEDEEDEEEGLDNFHDASDILGDEAFPPPPPTADLDFD